MKTGRTGYQFLELPALEANTPVTVASAFEKAKSGLPILIKAGGLSGFTFDSTDGSSTYARLPIQLIVSGTPTLAYIDIQVNDQVELVI